MITCMVYVFMALLEFALVYRVYNTHQAPLLPLTNFDSTNNNDSMNGGDATGTGSSGAQSTTQVSHWEPPVTENLHRTKNMKKQMIYVNVSMYVKT